MKYVTLLLIMIIFGDLSLAQIGNIAGKICDEDTRNPVAGALVMLGDEHFSTSSGRDGTFAFHDVPIGKYVIIVAHHKYKLWVTRNLRVESGKPTTLEIPLRDQEKRNPMPFFIPDPRIRYK